MKKLLENHNIMLVSSPDTAEKTNAIKEELESILTLNVETYTVPYDKFADGAYNTEFKNRLSWKHIIVYADCYSDDPSGDLNSKYMFYRHILSACQQNRVDNLSIIYPCFPYSRSDKEADAGWANWSKKVPIMAPLVLDDASRHGVDSLITLDVHNNWIFSRNGIDMPNNIVNLYYKWMIEYAMRDLEKEHIEIGSTDLWWTKKIKDVAKVLSLNNFMVDKDRNKKVANSVSQVFVMQWFASINSKHIIIYDDMIDTWWTICTLIDKLTTQYSPKSITIVSPHGMFNWNALEKLEAYHKSWVLKELIISDSVSRKSLPEWITILKTHRLFANTIASLLEGTSIDRNAW